MRLKKYLIQPATTRKLLFQLHDCLGYTALTNPPQCCLGLSGTYSRVLGQLDTVHRTLHEEKKARLAAESAVLVARIDGERAADLQSELECLR